MILLNKSQPEKSLYVIGAFLIEKLREYTEPFRAVELFEESKAELGVEFPHFILTLDWMYMEGLLEIADEGKLAKCF